MGVRVQKIQGVKSRDRVGKEDRGGLWKCSNIVNNQEWRIKGKAGYEHILSSLLDIVGNHAATSLISGRLQVRYRVLIKGTLK